MLICLLMMMALGIYASQNSRYRASVQGISTGRVRAQTGAVLTMTLGMMVFGISGIILILIT